MILSLEKKPVSNTLFKSKLFTTSKIYEHFPRTVGQHTKVLLVQATSFCIYKPYYRGKYHMFAVFDHVHTHSDIVLLIAENVRLLLQGNNHEAAHLIPNILDEMPERTCTTFVQ
jgi:hypothetical protein